MSCDFAKTKLPNSVTNTLLTEHLLPLTHDSQHHPIQKRVIIKMDSGSEGQARNLKNHIAELESRLAHPHHWTEGENKQNAEKLRQLIFERERLISTQDGELDDFI